MAKDTRFKYYHRPKDRLPGGNAARNYGFEMSRGVYIQWFDSDDIMLPNFLEKKVAIFTPTAVLTICNGYSADANLQNRKLKTMPAITNLFKQYVLWQSGIMSPSVIFRRTYLEGKTLFNENLICAQESEFFPRIFIFMERIKYEVIKEGLYLYRIHPNSKSMDKNQDNPNYLRSLGTASLNNLKLAVLSKDEDIINHIHKSCLEYFFAALNRGNRNLSWYFSNRLLKMYWDINRKYTLIFGGYLYCCILIGRPIHFIKKKLLKYSWK